MQALDIRLRVSLLLPGKCLTMSEYDLCILYLLHCRVVILRKECKAFQVEVFDNIHSNFSKFLLLSITFICIV